MRKVRKMTTTETQTWRALADRLTTAQVTSFTCRESLYGDNPDYRQLLADQPAEYVERNHVDVERVRPYPGAGRGGESPPLGD